MQQQYINSEERMKINKKNLDRYMNEKPLMVEAMELEIRRRKRTIFLLKILLVEGILIQVALLIFLIQLLV